MMTDWNYRKVSLAIILLFATSLSYAQDIHFSQFNQAPLVMNPALTGSFNGKNRVFFNYKDQWRDMAARYRTQAFSYDMPLFKRKWKVNYLGLGFLAFKDRAGDSQLGTTQLSMSLSGAISLDNNQTASAGLQYGFAQASIDVSGLKWGNQFAGGVHHPSRASGEIRDFSPFSYPDFSAGINWNYSIKNRGNSIKNLLKANVGAALFHINKPVQKFSANKERLHSKLVLHGDAYIRLTGEQFALLPSFLFLNQGSAIEINLGTMVRYKLQGHLEYQYTDYVRRNAVLIGAYYRTSGSFIPVIMLEHDDVALGISYDIDISGLSTAGNGRGGIEFTLRYINPMKKARSECLK